MNAPARPALLEAHRLSKSFSRTEDRPPALHDVSLELDAGAAIAVVGESGSGKSTLLGLLAGIEPPSSGEVRFQGRALPTLRGAARDDYRRSVQLIFQDPFASLNPVRRVAHALERPLSRNRSIPRSERAERAGRLFASVGLPESAEFRERFPHELSGGQRQRVAIARALATEPRALLADEPTSMLDVSIRIGILNLFRRLRQEQGIALLYVTHDIASARYVADQLRVMYAGCIVESGPSDEVLAAPAHPYTHKLLAAVPGSRFPDLPKLTSKVAGGRDGCPFRAACPRAVKACSELMPEATKLGAARSVRCHSPIT